MSDRRTGFAAAAMLLAAGAFAGGLLPDRVAEFIPGDFAGFGNAAFPHNVLSGPDGGSNPPFEPSDDPANILSLGEGGTITLEWSGDAILDGPGPDFIVFENVLETIGTGVPFVDAGIVAVGETTGTMVEFPFRFEPPPGWDSGAPYAIDLFAANYVGLAGTRATLATPTNGIDPSDPALAGGNAFDLADLGLAYVRFVRIADPRRAGTSGARTGTNGLPIYDSQGMIGNGFELDTILAINFGPVPTVASAANWNLYE